MGQPRAAGTLLRIMFPRYLRHATLTTTKISNLDILFSPAPNKDANDQAKALQNIEALECNAIVSKKWRLILERKDMKILLK